MCGIFGMLLMNKGAMEYKGLERSMRLLFLLSEARGQDSAGVAAMSGDEIQIFRRVKKPSDYLRDPGFRSTLKSAYIRYMQEAREDKSFIIIGQCRLVTNGSYAIHENNQPVHAGHIVGIHNGIITNLDTAAAVTAESGLVDSDTKLFCSRIDSIFQREGDFEASVKKAFAEIEGSASFALLCDREEKLIIATNNGSLYYVQDPQSKSIVFASEYRILKDFLKRNSLFDNTLSSQLKQVKPGTILAFGKGAHVHAKQFMIRDIKSTVSSLKRCTRCVLPHTYPFISFDERGVCNFCNQYERQKFHGSEALERFLEQHRSRDGSPDCLVGLSGGRDSTYGLHMLKTKYGMHPIAYTYDWGLTTDASRRNQAKVCGKLGVEHIIRAPDIQKKRRHIRKNIYAWLKDPKLGMVPLFMAGDKDFYHYGRKLRHELGFKLTVFCSGYLLEQRDFFVGFCGVRQRVTTTARLYHYSKWVKAQLALWYIMQYLKNPSYINESFFDSIRSYFTSFLSKDDFLYLYEYLPWEEKKMEELLRKEYGWEDYKAYGPNQWRMGDGQTAFTNYIYYTVAGFTEFDNFRSNQIREGLLSRDEALKLVELDNRPKYETLQYFSYVVGFNLDEVLAKINTIPKLY